MRQKGTPHINSIEARQQILDDIDKKHVPTRELAEGAEKHFDAIMRHRPYGEWPEDDRIVAEILAEVLIRLEAATYAGAPARVVTEWINIIYKLRSTLNLHQAGKVRTAQKTGQRTELGRRLEDEARQTVQQITDEAASSLLQ